MGDLAVSHAFGGVLRAEDIRAALRWRKPRRVLVTAPRDVFHDSISDERIAQFLAVMLAAKQHTFQIVTEWHTRMQSLMSSQPFANWVFEIAVKKHGYDFSAQPWWPLPNVWLGVSVDNQQRADARIPALLDTPAAVRFVSAEPLLGPISLESLPWTPPQVEGFSGVHNALSGEWWPAVGDAKEEYDGRVTEQPRINWVVVGGESGPDARPMHPGWVRGIRDQCVAAEVPFFLRHWGEYLTATVVDDPQYSGGRAFNDPIDGHRSAAVIRERGPSGTFRNGITRPMRPGDRTQGGQMIDWDTMAVRVGKRRAGRELDGRTWDERPVGAR